MLSRGKVNRSADGGGPVTEIVVVLLLVSMLPVLGLALIIALAIFWDWLDT